jgi:malonyl CoA-acyl carrier protein transacylase
MRQENRQMEMTETVGHNLDRQPLDRSQRAAMRFGLSVGVMTVTAMLAGIYASAILALMS